ncbi:SlyX family protein [Faucicola mancuniensis]|uniref:SlyX family protein n=1 Tax=Faucicola mancuniensis TaxID=1309795 RepID=UPI0028F09923|nr:SlyX family protein [uncultured Moraxella sp.]
MPTLNLLEEKITNLQNSLIELQTQTAFMENTIDVLNDIVTNQSQQLADQQRMLQLLYQKLNALPNDSQIQPFDLFADKPPHY